MHTEYRLQAFYEFCNFYGFLLIFLLLPFTNIKGNTFCRSGTKAVDGCLAPLKITWTDPVVPFALKGLLCVRYNQT
jgi:hypothetical protein